MRNNRKFPEISRVEVKKMPPNCGGCRFQIVHQEGYGCALIPNYWPEKDWAHINREPNRLPTCPLVERKK